METQKLTLEALKSTKELSALIFRNINLMIHSNEEAGYLSDAQ